MSEQFIPLSHITKKSETPLQIDLSVYNTERAKNMGEQLTALGFMNGAGVIQGDVAVSLHMDPTNPLNGSDKPLCWINCSIEGGYNCPARRFANPGLTSKGLAPYEKISQAFITAGEGIRIFNRQFLEEGLLDRYCQTFQIPEDIKKGIGYNLLHGNITANIFGGEAAVHPDVMKIAKDCHDAGLIVNLTTTGDILLTSKGQKFLEELSQGYINVLAVSGEFKDAQDVKRLANLQLDTLKQERTSTPVTLGQVRKRVAAAYTGQLSEVITTFPQLLFNVVVHEHNIELLEEILSAIDTSFPHAKSNPYPAQSAFEHSAPAFRLTHIPALQQFTANRITEQQSQHPNRVLRPHYYAMLTAIFHTFSNNSEKILEYFSGYQTWKCYEDRYKIPGAGRVVQFGASPEIRHVPDHAGDTLSCFWNEGTVTRQRRHVSDMNPQEVAAHIHGGMQTLSGEMTDPCGGCLFPRLTGDILTQDLGLDPKLYHAYQEVMKEFWKSFGLL